MAKINKKSLKSRVEAADLDKKVNPLDLSADQDLSIALMNLLILERQSLAFGCPALYDSVYAMRQNLMTSILKDKAINDVAARLLLVAMLDMDAGVRLLQDGDNAGAYKMFDSSYESYSMFWGINMGMVDKKVAEEILNRENTSKAEFKC